MSLPYIGSHSMIKRAEEKLTERNKKTKTQKLFLLMLPMAAAQCLVQG